MLKSLRYFVAVAAVALVVLAVTTSDSHAQVRVLPNSQSLINPYYRVAPGLSLNQAAYNISVLNRAYATAPPWFYYNPYPPPIIYTPYVAPPYPYPYYGGLNPYSYYTYPYATGFAPFYYR